MTVPQTLSGEIQLITIDNPTPEKHLRTEWLLTNGLGGYAMGTVMGVNTRRYHGLLVASLDPPVNRVVALHSMIEQLVIPKGDGAEEVIDLSTQMFVGADGTPMLHPQGWRRLIGFDHVPAYATRWFCDCGAVVVERRLRSWVGMNVAALSYGARQELPGVRLRVRPLLAMRNAHSLGVPETPVAAMLDGDVVGIGCNGLLMHVQHSEWTYRDDPQWWRDFFYVEEAARGQRDREDLWSPGTFEAPLLGKGLFAPLLLAVVHPSSDDPSPISDRRTEERRHVQAGPYVTRRRGSEAGWDRSILAGFPWFADWGRDAMIAVPGLLLTTGRFDEARDVLLTFARHMKHGLIPNRFADDGGPAEYNTVDASLWFVYAAWQYWQAAGAGGTTAPPEEPAAPLATELIDACRSIIRAYRHGIRVDEGGHRFSIGLTRDGLVNAGDETTQLTWMDAKRDGVVFTPRHGLAVEVNALWHNALHCLAAMTADEVERESLREFGGQVAIAFQMHFWWGEHSCLHDVLSLRSVAARIAPYEPDGSFRFPAPVDRSHPSDAAHEWTPDGKLRPNQILAASLPHSALTMEQRRLVVECCRRRFLTPFGLRTLDRSDPAYCPRYEGSLFDRDRAYHNGTVWPWLIGPYCEAMLRANGFSAAVRREARRLIQPLLNEMSATDGPRCLGQIAEVYDGDEPQRPAGCTAQAWSVAEVMRVQHLTQEIVDVER